MLSSDCQHLLKFIAKKKYLCISELFSFRTSKALGDPSTYCRQTGRILDTDFWHRLTPSRPLESPFGPLGPISPLGPVIPGRPCESIKLRLMKIRESIKVFSLCWKDNASTRIFSQFKIASIIKMMSFIAHVAKFADGQQESHSLGRKWESWEQIIRSLAAKSQQRPAATWMPREECLHPSWPAGQLELWPKKKGGNFCHSGVQQFSSSGNVFVSPLVPAIEPKFRVPFLLEEHLM